MKYLVSLAVGLIVGVALFLAAMYLNPLAASPAVSPLAVTDQPVTTLEYAAEPKATVFRTGSDLPRQPESAAQLWEPTVRQTRLLVVEMADSRGRPAGVGVKFSTRSEQTKLINSEALIDSAWHVYLPERGTLFASQTENFWSYLRDVVAKARLASTGTWRGAFSSVMTVGPNALGTGRVIGGSGEFSGREGELVESLNASAYSVDEGPVGVRGTLVLALPAGADVVSDARD